MTSTQTKISNSAARLSQLTGMESFSFKIVSILFLVIINITGLSSQNLIPRSQKCSAPIKPSFDYNKKALMATPANIAKVKHLQAVRNFPTLEGEAKQELPAVEFHELFDYDLIFENALSKAKESPKVKPVTLLSITKI